MNPAKQRALASQAAVSFNLCLTVLSEKQVVDVPSNDRLRSKLRERVGALAMAEEGDARRLWLDAERLWWELALTEERMALFEARRCGSTPDMEQEARIGLHKAAKRWDQDRNVAFRTYARWWVKAILSRAYEEQERTIPLAFNARTKLYLAQRLEEYGADPCDAGLDREEYGLLSAVDQHPVELDAPIADGHSGEPRPTGENLLRDEWTPEDEITGWEEREILKARIAKLDTRTRTVLLHRLNGGVVSEMSKKGVHLSKERIRQLTLDALHALRGDGGTFAPSIVTDVFGYQRPTRGTLAAAK